MKPEDVIPNVLAERYATGEMRGIWSARGRIVLERDFWIAVMKAQRAAGLDLPAEAIAAYEAVRDRVDLDSIKRREIKTRHDVKARIEEFSDLAGFQHAHKGLTSRDLTECVEQLQIYRSLLLLRDKSVAALATLASRAAEWRDLVLTARTHFVPAQPTTFGKRLAMFGEEFEMALGEVQHLIESYPARGLKGAVGTQLDAMTLLNGRAEALTVLETAVADHLGIPGQLHAVGQIYPRSLDFEVVATLNRLAAGPSSFATTWRLMAGLELAGEGFAEGQVGSSAMPHKTNARSCERLTGFKTILDGYLTMAAGLSGRQWNEGDVSCSVVRRVFLPDAFFTADGMLETFLTVLREMTVYPAMAARENERYLPFLATTTLLMEAVKAGAGRESAHLAIKEQALQVAQDLRAGRTDRNDLGPRLAADPRLGLSAQRIAEIIGQSAQLVGQAPQQVDHFIQRAGQWANRFPAAANYRPQPIL